MERGTMMNI